MLFDFVQGALGKDAEGQLDEHLDLCADCRRSIAAVAQTLRAGGTASEPSSQPAATCRQGPPLTGEHRALLQRRITLFVRAMALLSAALYALAVFLAWLVSTDFAIEYIQRPERLLHLFLTLFLAGGWLHLSSAREYSAAVLRRADVVGLLGVVALLGAIHGLESTGAQGAMLSAITIGYLLILRAVIVPSHERRTLVLCAAATAITLATRAVAVITPIGAASGSLGAQASDFSLLLFWLTFSCAVATIASRVIFGLRREVHRAMTVGQYTLKQQIGRGGMGVVYRATHALLRRDTAIKLLPSGTAGSEEIDRFAEEVYHTAQLTHPNTVAIFDYGRTQDGIFYYAMEYVDGVDLQQLVARFGALPVGRVVHLLRQVLASLTEAHEMGLVHRDIKPANVVITDRGNGPDMVKVLDFGLVRRVTGDTSAAVSGTPQYLAPECIRTPRSVGPAADLYAASALGFFLLTATPVFRGESVAEICAQHLHAAPEPPSTRRGQSVPAALEALLLRGLAKDPRNRPSSARRFREELESCRDVLPWTEHDARDWWSCYRASPSGTAGPAGRRGTTMLTIDLAVRQEAPSRGHHG